MDQYIEENITVTAGSDILVKGSHISTEKVKVTLNAGENINIENATERHERLHEFHEKVSGILSTKTTDIYDVAASTRWWEAPFLAEAQT